MGFLNVELWGGYGNFLVSDSYLKDHSLLDQTLWGEASLDIYPERSEAIF